MMETILMNNETSPKASRFWSKRRVVLLASVAAVGAGVMLAGPAYPPIALNATPARAVEAMQPQAGFADLVEKVKPAVISVRVKIDQTADATDGSGNSRMEQFGDSEGLQRFFRQFGMPDMPNFRSGPQGAPQGRHQ